MLNCGKFVNFCKMCKFCEKCAIRASVENCGKCGKLCKIWIVLDVQNLAKCIELCKNCANLRTCVQLCNICRVHFFYKCARFCKILKKCENVNNWANSANPTKQRVKGDLGDHA